MKATVALYLRSVVLNVL